MGQACSHLYALHGTHRPPKGAESQLFDRSHIGDAANAFQDLICCPSRHGAHIIFASDSSLLYKVKVHSSQHEEAPRFDVYEVNENGKAVEISMGYLEKAHTEIQASKGFFHMKQWWHVSCSKLEMKERKGVLHPKTKKNLATPSEAWHLDGCYELKCERDFDTKTEEWTRNFIVNDQQYVMKADLSSTPAKSVVRLLSRGELIAVGRMQSFGHVRGIHQRPFLGIHLLATQEDLGIEERPTMSRSGTFSSVVSSLTSGSSSQPTGVPNGRVLALLLVLAWGEEAIVPPNDRRDHFIRRMRNKNKDTIERWESNEGPSFAPPVGRSLDQQAHDLNEILGQAKSKS